MAEDNRPQWIRQAVDFGALAELMGRAPGGREAVAQGAVLTERPVAA